MGVNLADLVEREAIDLSQLRGKPVAIDALNILYQFLAIIRQRDGELLKDTQGRVTSHLSGLFYRSINLLEEGVKPVYVFDGKPPSLKHETLAKRRDVKREARREWQAAVEEGRTEDIKKFAQQTSKLTDEMLSDARVVLDSMGIPYVQAPSEGEAQAAYLARKKDAYAAASQDYDSLLFGAPRLVRNLTLTGKRKLPGKDVYVTITTEQVILDAVLQCLSLTREQLVEVALLIGTDYNPGITGIGPKTALRIVKEGKFSEYGLDELKELFLSPDVTDDYEIRFGTPSPEHISEILCEEHDFSETRVESAVERLVKATETTIKQTSLDAFF
ncbi:MAG: flap endonuclease-1 [Theionarchaea archaeon]|nr:flap endonuclease-1 [Theionarchaea archaeon]MBU7020437.1 flap endonuclease-1 [Theionarchaea archaeon]MBU7034784.1 flap endonuclease-1 [Theionarchaea archaeon]MBU7040878.1 flap endonuclease-1 [Theionarchaea archaeon]